MDKITMQGCRVFGLEMANVFNVLQKHKLAELSPHFHTADISKLSTKYEWSPMDCWEKNKLKQLNNRITLVAVELNLPSIPKYKGIVQKFGRVAYLANVYIGKNRLGNYVVTDIVFSARNSENKDVAFWRMSEDYEIVNQDYYLKHMGRLSLTPAQNTEASMYIKPKKQSTAVNPEELQVIVRFALMGLKHYGYGSLNLYATNCKAKSGYTV